MSWNAEFGLQWIDAATGVTHKLTFPRDALTALAGAVAANAVDVLLGPQIITPPIGGNDPPGNARLPDGSILTMGGNGEIYRDGLQLPGVAARQMVQFGNSIYAQGKTNPAWWQWTGAKWVAVTAFDSNILVNLPGPIPA